MINRPLYFQRRDFSAVVCRLLTLVFLSFGLFAPLSWLRTVESLKDFVLMIGYYYAELFNIPHSISPTVNIIPDSLNGILSIVPENAILYKKKFFIYWTSFGNVETLRAFFGEMLRGFSLFVLVISAILPLIVALIVFLKRNKKIVNNDYDEDTKPLRAFKSVINHTYYPVKEELRIIISYIQEHNALIKIWALIWLVNLNVLTVVFDIFAYLIYLLSTFDVLSAYLQVYKVGLDLSVVLANVPLLIYLILGICWFLSARKKWALRSLRGFEGHNQLFLSNTPLALFVVGSMGAKKTTVMTDMTLSLEVIYRKTTLELMLDTALTFPDFPWINFENELKKAISKHKIYSLSSCRKWLSEQASIFAVDSSPRNLYGYNYERYGITYCDELNNLHLYDILEDYSQLYFIYTIQSSLIVANYGVRSDNIMKYNGNFPLWNTDFFNRSPKERLGSNYAHILDFDMLRLGLKVVEDNPLVGALEFGVIVISEGAKERGNQNDTKELKKNVAEANQKNDLFNLRLKLARHTATVKYTPFVKYLMDDQRPESLNADAKDLFTIVHVVDGGERSLALRGFFLEELLHDIIYPGFERFALDERFRRGDNTLTMYLYKHFAALVHNHYVRTYNRFGYSRAILELEAGTQDGKRVEQPYYLCNAKIYADRFSTDCFRGYFDELSANCEYGIDDIPTYSATTADLDELDFQNSFFIKSLARPKNTKDGE